MSTSETNRRHPNVINLDEIDARSTEKGTKFGASFKQLGSSTGASAVGCNWFEVAPGRSAFPFHYHCAIEEAIFVISGRGTLRIGEESVLLRPGDYVTFSAGPDNAHRLDNTGSTPLQYLCMSSRAVADVVGYPDSGKIAAVANPRANFFDQPWVRGIYRAEETVDYYEGEDVGR